MKTAHGANILNRQRQSGFVRRNRFMLRAMEHPDALDILAERRQPQIHNKDGNPDKPLNEGQGKRHASFLLAATESRHLANQIGQGTWQQDKYGDGQGD